MKNIGKKILKIMGEVKSIKKDAYNSFHKYKYTSNEAVVSRLREEMIKNNLLVSSSQSNYQRIGELTSVEVAYTLTDLDSGEQIISSFFGEGQDKGDKGIYKATTGAEKYFLLKTFSISTSDDPERDLKNDPKSTPQKQQKPKPFTFTREPHNGKTVHEVNDVEFLNEVLSSEQASESLKSDITTRLSVLKSTVSPNGKKVLERIT